MNVRAWSIIGGQAGSEGKGKAAAYIAAHEHPEISACAFTANAGHTAYTVDGTKIVVHTLPIGAFFGSQYAVIGPGSAISLQRLIDEVAVLHTINPRCTVVVDPNAVIITKEQVEWETERMKKISSTCQGVGKAQADRVLRLGDATLAHTVLYGYPDVCVLGSAVEFLMRAYQRGDRIQIEGCQGIDIDMLHGLQYPYTTSRSVSSAAVANDCGFPAKLVDAVVGVYRTYPIRVGNVYENDKMVGWSGPGWDASTEVTWAELTELAGSPEPLEEHTTVTKKVRRVFTWSKPRFEYSVWINAVTHVWLNFIDYVDWGLHTVAGDIQELEWISPRAAQWLLANLEDTPIRAAGTGPGMDEVFASGNLNRDHRDPFF